MGIVRIHGGVFTGVASALLAGAGGIVVAEQWTWPWYLGWASIALGAGLLLWGIRVRGIGLIYFFRGKRARRKAFAAREAFSGETIAARELILPGAPVATGKQFTECVIRGPARIIFVNQCTLVFCSAQMPITMVPEGHDASDAVGFFGCTFERCYFEDAEVIMVPEDFAKVAPSVAIEPRKDWKARNAE